MNAEIVSIYQKESFPHSLDVLMYLNNLLLDYELTASNEDEELEGFQECCMLNMRQLLQELASSRCRRLSWEQNSNKDYTSHQYDWSALEVLEIHPVIMDPSKGFSFVYTPQLRTLCLMMTDHHLDAMAKFCPWEQIQDLLIVNVKTDFVNLCSVECLQHLTVYGFPWN